MFASIHSFTKNDPICMAYHPYHFVGEVLLHTVYCILQTIRRTLIFKYFFKLTFLLFLLLLDCKARLKKILSL